METVEIQLPPANALAGANALATAKVRVGNLPRACNQPFSDSVPVPAFGTASLPSKGVEDVERGSVPAYRDQLRLATLPIREELTLVEQMLHSELKVAQPHIAEMLSYVADLGGKRLRPSLLLLAAKASGIASEESIRLSVVVELVHTATLVHDDILDSALVRRHKETVHKRWTVPASVLVGDWLFTHAYGLANKGNSTIPGRWIADAAKQVCEGEMMQGHSIRHFEMEVPEYIRLLDAKTGALCALSCSLGAWSAGADEATCHRLQQYGLKLGTAFQVFDDWLDVWGTQDYAGKTLGTDLGSFKPTLPAIRTLECLPTKARETMISRLNNGDISAAVELRSAMENCDASEYTKRFAKELIEEAVRYLDGFPANASVTALRTLAMAAVERQG